MPSTTMTTPVTRVVFIDSRVPDTSALTTPAGDGEIRVIVDAASDGLAQMAGMLAAYTAVESVHIVAYASEGELLLGKSLISEATLSAAAPNLEAIGQSLSGTADILIYGGNLAAGPAGLQFLQTLATLTQADVAASDDGSGGAGDWDLEVAVGSIGAAALDLSSYSPSLSGYMGAPLSGSIQGSAGDDYYFGTQYAPTNPPLFDIYSAMRALTVIDPGGDDVIRAENLFGRLDYFSRGIDSSSFTLGDGFITLSVLVEQGYYVSGIEGGSLVMGSGGSELDVAVVEHPSRSFIYAATGISGWNLLAGAGNDHLRVTLQASPSQTFSSTGVAGGSLDFGTGADTLVVRVTNTSGSQESTILSGTVVDMGDDDDIVDLHSTGYGVSGSTLDLGAGDDLFDLSSTRSAFIDSTIFAGDGADTLVLTASSPNSVELLRSTVDLGAGDDRIELRMAIDGAIDGGDGYDTLVLTDSQSHYQVVQEADGALRYTRTDNTLFDLRVTGVEAVIFGEGSPTFQYQGTALSGFLTGTAERHDFYHGVSLRAAIDDLTVVDLEGNDRVLAENLTESGGFSSYLSTAISSSNFTFGDGVITFEARINQGYYAKAVTGGSLRMGEGNSFVSLVATEDFPAERFGFYYGVTGAENWTFEAGGGRDVLSVLVRGSKTETFSSIGINGGSYALGNGSDVVDVLIENVSGTGESVGIASASVDLGQDDDRLSVVSTGYGIRASNLSGGDGVDTIDITTVRDAITDTLIATGEGNDAVFARSSGGNNADLVRVSVQTGDGHDYVECRIAIESSIDFGDGYDILRLRGESSSYVVEQTAAGAFHITRIDDPFFGLSVSNLESILFGTAVVETQYSGTPLTGFLGGTAVADDVYRGTGLSAAIENLVVRDATGNDTVIALNISNSGWVSSYFSTGITGSDFEFGDGDITFSAMINQGYYARAISDTRLSMGDGSSYVSIVAAEDYPALRTGFIYDVRGALNLELLAGGGADVVEVIVAASREGGISSTGIAGGRMLLESGDDNLHLVLHHGTANPEARAISAVTELSLGQGNDAVVVFSSGSGIDASTIEGGDGDDRVYISAERVALDGSSLMLGEGADRVVLLGTEGGLPTVSNATIDLGGGDDELRVGSGSGAVFLGGEGNDRLHLLGDAEDYVIEALADGTSRVSLVVAPEQSFTVSGFEEVVFGPPANLGAAALEVQGALQVHRVLSVIELTPDPEGRATALVDCLWQSSDDGSTWRDIGNGSEYTLKAEDEGQLIRALVRYFDGDGNPEVVACEPPTRVVAPEFPAGTDASSSPDLSNSMLVLDAGTTDAGLGGTIYTGASGNSSDNRISGNDLGNFVDGGMGSDTLAGGTGRDVLLGGEGDDQVDAGQGDDLIIGGDGEGEDTYNGGVGFDGVVYTSSVAPLRINLVTGRATGAETGTDHLVSIESVVAGRGSDVVTGNGKANLLEGFLGDDSLSGGSGADTLDGGAGNDVLNGGNGADAMSGGPGDDTYTVNTAGDLVTEQRDEGLDTVRTNLSYTLGLGIEQLLLLGGMNVSAVGNDDNNTVIGNDGNNRLLGAAGDDTLRGGLGKDTLNGGAGDDSLAGGSGDDTYILDSVTDLVTELSGGGNDLVRTTADVALAGNIENLLLLEGALNGEGNGGANQITGNAAANRLAGGAGDDTLTGLGGPDTLAGGEGNDSYFVTFGDQVVESAGQGIDTVSSAVGWTLAAQVENLVLTGAANAAATGNAAANQLIGNVGNNRLQGFGGRDTLSGGVGKDTLTGGSGADVFIFDAVLDGISNVDLLTDVVTGLDKLQLDEDIFAGLSAGVGLTAVQFASGADLVAAETTEQRIVYDTNTGALYYDADGAGGVAAVQFAVLGTTTHPALTAGDFVIVA